MKKIRLAILACIFIFSSKLTSASVVDTLVVIPNPFDSVAVIHFSISNNDSVWLNVFNTNGQTIKTYYNGVVMSSGSYSVNFNGDSLANGIYFVQLKINSNKLTRKIIKNSNTLNIQQNINVNAQQLFYPNPTNGVVEIPYEGIKTIIVTNMQSKTMKRLSTELTSIPLLDLPNGNYYISVLTLNNQLLATKQIIKAN